MTRLGWVGIVLATVTLTTGAGVLTFRTSGSQDQVLPTREPDLVANNRDVMRANAEVRPAKANAHPDVYTLYQPYTFQNNTYSGVSGADSWALGVTTTIPISDRNKGDSAAKIPGDQPSQSGGGAGPVRSYADLLSAQSRVGQRAYEQALASYRDGKVNLDKVHLWSHRLMQAQIATAEGNYIIDPKARAVYVAAAKAHRDRMRQLEELVRASRGEGRRPAPERLDGGVLPHRGRRPGARVRPWRGCDQGVI